MAARVSAACARAKAVWRLGFRKDHSGRGAVSFIEEGLGVSARKAPDVGSVFGSTPSRRRKKGAGPALSARGDQRAGLACCWAVAWPVQEGEASGWRATRAVAFGPRGKNGQAYLLPAGPKEKEKRALRPEPV